MIKVEILLPEVRAILPPSAYLFESTGKDVWSKLPKASEGLGLDNDSARSIAIQADKDKGFYSLKIAKDPRVVFLGHS